MPVILSSARFRLRAWSPSRAASPAALKAAAALAVGAMVLGTAACNASSAEEFSRAPIGSTKVDASPITRFTYTGSPGDPLIVPAGVTLVHVDFSGGSGGQAVDSCKRGLGARVTGTLPVQPGDSIVVAVGGQGKAGDKNKNPGAGGWGSPAAYSGGGGGRAHGSADSDGDGGGGATTISVNNTVVAVAAGAGGGGGMAIATCYGGGNGGNDSGGENGQGSKSLAGVGGSASNPANSRNGGDSSRTLLQSGGGGGGGGHFVGAGGHAGVDGGGGGGGSSLTTALTGASVVAAAAGDGNATLSYTDTVAATISGTPPAGRVGTPYSFGFSTTGSPAPTVSQNQGELPDGLNIDDQGVITGTPNTVGTFHFSVTASNAKGDSDPLRTQIVIEDAGAVGVSPNPQNFTYSGTVETVIVPVGVTGAQVVLDGAAGGGGGGSATNQPGRGAEVKGTLPVEPGDTLEIGVGGQGQPNDGNKNPGAGGWGSAPKYSGGRGGSGHGTFDSDASGGGGATTLAVNGTVQVVAAGAGGASSVTLGKAGWAGGAGGGEDGGHAGSSSVSDSGGGKGGAPGTSYENDRDGLSGGNPSAGGGGGGGGYFPGQGGRSSALGEGGGGGSSLTKNLTGATATVNVGATGSGKITWLGSAPTIAGEVPAATASKPVNFTFTTTGSPNVSVTAGTLPAGLSLSRSGHLTGTPTTAGSSDLTITATNYFGSAPLKATLTVQ